LQRVSTKTSLLGLRPIVRLVALFLVVLALLQAAGCSRPGVASPRGDQAAAQRAAASEGRQQPARQSRPQSEPSLLGSSDIALAYSFVLDSYVDRVEYAPLIEAARGALSEALSQSGALPIDNAPLDLLPLTTGSLERDLTAFSSAFDAVIQRHPEWSLHTRPDYLAISKMIESLGDNHSTFLTPEETRRRSESSYSGIGVRIARPDSQGPPVVIEVFHSSPAAIAGVKVGDRIVAVGDRDMRQASLEQVAEQIKGPQGSEVVLHLERTAEGAITVHAFRRTIETPQADGQLLDSRVGYIKIRNFGDTVAERVGRLLLEQRQAGAQGWIIDLRGNPGGDLQAVARVAGYFMDSRPIGITVNRGGQREAIFAEQRPFSIKAPLVVLVDGDTGSGSEILAASFREYQLALLVGQKTAGSVGIANTRQLSNGSTVQLTVRRLLSASGAQLDRLGVQPDEAVTLSAQDLEAGQDPQRDEAVKLLRERLPQA
jgi:carboxyl-terminal processing protease